MKVDGPLVVMSLYRSLPPQCQAAADRLGQAGIAVARLEGNADVSYSANSRLSLGLCSGADPIVSIDDDMVYTPDQVIGLIRECNEKQRPVSGVYVDRDGRLLAEEQSWGWRTGLGFLAIPRKCLLEIAEKSPEQEPEDHIPRKWVFCNSGIYDGEWIGEDYHLCKRLGGVELSNIAVGHLKPQVMYPSKEAIEGLFNG